MFSHSKLIQTVKPKRRIDVMSLTLGCNVDEMVLLVQVPSGWLFKADGTFTAQCLHQFWSRFLHCSLHHTGYAAYCNFSVEWRFGRI